MNHVQRGASFGTTVGPGQVAVHNQARAVLHHRMPHEAPPRCLEISCKARPHDQWSRQYGVRTLLAPEIDFGIAVLVGGAGHRLWLKLGLGLDGLVYGDVVSGRITRPLIL